jgi:ELWxxDGT repeat protein
VSNLLAVGKTAFFAGFDKTHGTELWKTDGTPEGTALLKDVTPGAEGRGPSQFVAHRGRLYFTASRDRAEGTVLWSSDGTTEGTTPVRRSWPAVDPLPGNLTPVGELLAFSVRGRLHGQEVWVTDGTHEGTARVTDVYPGRAGSSPESFCAYGGALYFTATDGRDGLELWRAKRAKP